MTDQTHLNALELRLSHERDRLRTAKTEAERKLRRAWIAQIEREVSAERHFLGLADVADDGMSDEDILAALGDE